mmetsp:Transcript_32221/g.103398  ORF Transcript_32221/g.103398 Transcript_32221/m.103398 type:complete len:339 (-) Transcript_32221:1106-2122(-)
MRDFLRRYMGFGPPVCCLPISPPPKQALSPRPTQPPPLACGALGTHLEQQPLACPAPPRLQREPGRRRPRAGLLEAIDGRRDELRVLVGGGGGGGGGGEQPERGEPPPVDAEGKPHLGGRPARHGDRDRPRRGEEGRADALGIGAEHVDERLPLPPADHARAAQAERVERRPERARVAGVRVGVDAAGHPKDERAPLLAVVAEDLARHAKGDARPLGEPLLRRVRRVVALLAEPDRVDVRVELRVRQVRVAIARRVQVEQERVGALGGERLEGGAEAAQHRALVRRAVEVDAVDVDVPREPQDALEPVVVPPGRKGGRVHRRVHLAVGEPLVPRGRIV